MKAVVLLVFAAAVVAPAARGAELSYEDCLLTNLRGVSSDSAAVLIRRACESKREAANRAAEDARELEFGEVATYAQLQAIEVRGWADPGPGDAKLEVFNAGKATITYLRLNVASKVNGDCLGAGAVPFRLTLRPLESAWLPISYVDPARPMCVSVGYARLRDSNQVKDRLQSWSKGVTVLRRDLFADRGDVLVPSAAPVHAPAAAPAPSASVLDARDDFRRIAEDASKKARAR